MQFALLAAETTDVTTAGTMLVLAATIVTALVKILGKANPLIEQLRQNNEVLVKAVATIRDAARKSAAIQQEHTAILKRLSEREAQRTESETDKRMDEKE